MTKKLLLAAALLAGSLAWGGQASATPITGALSLNGIDSFTSTSISFVNSTTPGHTSPNIGASTGAFAELGTCNGCGTMNSFAKGATNVLVYTVTNNGDTSTFTLANPTFTFVPGVAGGLDTLTIAGTGTATLTGFDTTPGHFLLTTQGMAGDGTFTFSSTTTASGVPVPEPASLTLLGTALLGLGLFGWRRKRV